jgi:hypothetical protein
VTPKIVCVLFGGEDLFNEGDEGLMSTLYAVQGLQE